MNTIQTDVDGDEVTELMQSETVVVGGNDTTLANVVSDIKKAHQELDEYKQGSLSLAQTLSEAADDAESEKLETILKDMSDDAFGAYLRLHRGDSELLGKRNGEYSGFLTE